MYSIEEAAEELEAAQVGSSVKGVISKLPSFRPSVQHRKTIRQPSFFQRAFSSSKLNKTLPADVDFFAESSKQGGAELAEGSQEKEGSDDGNFDPATAPMEGETVKITDPVNKPPTPATNTLPAVNEEKKVEEDDESIAQTVDSVDQRPPTPEEYYYDPPMPKIGRPVQVDRLINRNKTAASGMAYLMDMIRADVEVSIQKGKTVPVSKELDRVQVTQPIGDYMARVRTNQEITARVQNNFSDIQKSLNYRKSGIIMMNFNYQEKPVRRIEPIYVTEARTIIKYK
jgi:hypothetical protein